MEWEEECHWWQNGNNIFIQNKLFVIVKKHFSKHIQNKNKLIAFYRVELLQIKTHLFPVPLLFTSPIHNNALAE